MSKEEEIAELAADPLEMLFEAMRLIGCLNQDSGNYYMRNIWWPEANNLQEAFKLYKNKD